MIRISYGISVILCLLTFGIGGGCAMSLNPTGSEDREITLEMSSYPNRISAEDSTATAEIWATVRMGGKPVADSVLVAFATTVGKITEIGYTRDGLVIARLTGPGDGRPQRAEVVAQAMTVRDTIEVDVVLD